MPLRLVRYAARSENWYLRGAVRGRDGVSRHVFETTGTDQRALAEAIRIRRESELLDDSVPGRGAQRITFAEAALSYLQAGGEARFLGKFDETTGKWTLLIGRFGATPIAAIDQAAADDAARELLPRAGPATRIRHVYTPLAAVLNHAARKWRVPMTQLEKPKTKKPETRWVTPDYVAALLPHCAPRLRRLVMLVVYTGARLSEALRVDWDRDVDLQARTVVFRRTKTRMRTVHIADSLLAELAATPAEERRGAMFLWRGKSSVHRPLKHACARAGIAYVPPHQLGRHTFATWLRIYAKRDLKAVMEAGGWDSITSVARYAHVVPGETIAAVDALPAVQNACTAGVKPLKDRRLRRKSA